VQPLGFVSAGLLIKSEFHTVLRCCAGCSGLEISTNRVVLSRSGLSELIWCVGFSVGFVGVDSSGCREAYPKMRSISAAIRVKRASPP
jgi:hypothetical protein